MNFSSIKRHLRELFVSEQWHVGIVRAPIHSFLDPNQEFTVDWLPALPRTRFFADPFALWRGKELVILCEDFDYRKGRGSISAIRSLDGGYSFSSPIPLTGSVFDEPAIHKSYPFLFQHEGEIFCVPETFEKNEIALYRAAEFPQRWERVCALLSDVEGIDPTVFHHEGRWWMFYTTRKGGTSLSLFLASAPELEGPWLPHPLSPVKRDIAGGRPGGTPFLYEGNLYRPGQDSSVTYGGSLRIFRINKLTPTEYEEELVREVNLKRQHRYNQGFHTLTAAGNLCVVDGKRFLFVPQQLASVLKAKFLSVYSRLRN